MTTDEIKKKIRELQNKRSDSFNEHRKLVESIDQEIEDIQLICTHDEIELIPDPMRSWNECTICKADIRYINDVKQYRKERGIKI